MRPGGVVVVALALLGALPPATAGSHPGHGPFLVSIGTFAFSPQEARVTEGDAVLWDWAGPDTNHSVTATPGQAITFDSDAGKAPGAVAHPLHDGYAVTFPKAGTYTYVCKVHPFMRGTVVVAPLPAGSAPAAPVTPALTGVKVTTTHRCRSGRCTVIASVRYTLNEAVSVTATLRRLKGRRTTGRTLKEIDFAGPPGTHRRRLALGRLRPGQYRLRLVAIDNSTGTATAPAVATIAVPR